MKPCMVSSLIIILWHDLGITTQQKIQFSFLAYFNVLAQPGKYYLNITSQFTIGIKATAISGIIELWG